MANTFNLSKLLKDISDLSMDIEYEENLDFARKFLNLKGEDAKKFARGATLEQQQLDKEAIKSLSNTKILNRLSERRRLALSAISSKKKIQKNQDKLEEIYQLLSNLSL